MRAVLYPAEDVFYLWWKHMAVLHAYSYQIRRRTCIYAPHRPCMLMNWPNLSAAPRILLSLSTKRFIFASLRALDLWLSGDLWKNVDAVPPARDRARPEKLKQLVID